MEVRNFCIIAHIDHWKSTLADRMLEITNTMENLKHWQMLDKLELEQERWITIKLTPVRMFWRDYEFNLIDTPGHSDFQYEVSRSLVSVEGAILLIDASQWIQAQTLSTLYMALDKWLEIIPVLNKIDLPAAEPERVISEIENIIGLWRDEVIQVSAKNWDNVDKVLDRVIERFPTPEKFRLENLSNFYLNSFPLEKDLQIGKSISRALIFDSIYDKYKGVISYIKVLEWEVKWGDNVYLINKQKKITLTEVGFFSPDYVKADSIKEWEIGYVLTGLKSVRDAEIWDTMIKFDSDLFSLKESFVYNKNQWKFYEINRFLIPWFKKLKPFVYAWIYPLNNEDFEKLRNAFERLVLNDSAIEYEYEGSNMLGHWFRAGFLWSLHMEIIKERLYREFDIDTIFTNPNVIYLVKVKNFNLEKVKTWINISELVKSGFYKEVVKIESDKKMDFSEDENLNYPDLIDKYKNFLKEWILVRLGSDMPDIWFVEKVLEPMVDVEIVVDNDYTWSVMWLCQEHRWDLKNMEQIDENRLLVRYKMPLWEIITNFNDKLKTVTKGFSTMNYEFLWYRDWNLIRLDIYINSELIKAFSMVVEKNKAYHLGKEILEKLKEIIPKHMFAIPLQAAVWNKIIARETIKALKKDVLSKCYWWDVTRKRKLLAKQKEGKKRLKQVWKVSVPNDVFIRIMSK